MHYYVAAADPVFHLAAAAASSFGMPAQATMQLPKWQKMSTLYSTVQFCSSSITSSTLRRSKCHRKINQQACEFAHRIASFCINIYHRTEKTCRQASHSIKRVQLKQAVSTFEKYHCRTANFAGGNGRGGFAATYSDNSMQQQVPQVQYIVRVCTNMQSCHMWQVAYAENST